MTYAQRKKARMGQDPRESSHTSENAGHSQAADEDAQPVPEKDEEKQEAQPEDQPQAPVSDSDWLRSKTSRLLGLLDEDEQAAFEQPAAPVDDTPVADSDVGMPNAPRPEKPAVNDSEKAPTAAEVDTNIENIRISARLFIRNLSYETRESDLEPLFSPFGKIEEVRLLYSFFLFAISTLPHYTIWCNPCLNDDILLIGTSDAEASDVKSEERILVDASHYLIKQPQLL